MSKCIAVTAVLTLLVACSAGVVPWRDGVGGAFRPPDFAQDFAAGRVLAMHGDPYAGDFAGLHAQVLGIGSENGYPYLPHPPFALVLTWPFASVTFGVAALSWFAGSLACLFVLAIVLSGFARRQETFALPPLPDALVCFGALLVWPPVLYNLEKGQFSILIAMLVAVAWVSLSRHDSRAGGICLGLAAALKLFPALLVGYLLLRRRLAAMWFVVAAIAATCLPLLWIGWRAVPEFIAQSAGNLTYWQTWPAVTYSLRGVAARLLIGSDWALPIAHAPAIASGAVALASVVLLIIAVRTTLRHHRSPDADELVFAVWCLLLLPLNPLAMGHNGVLLALPIVLIGRALADDRRVWLKIVWSAGCVLVSIPRQAIFGEASFPITPWRSLAVVALPLWGTLLLLAAAVASAHSAAARAEQRCHGHTAVLTEKTA